MSDIKQVIVVRRMFPDENNLMRKIRTGKLMAQASHASMAWLSLRIQAAIGQTGKLEQLLKLSSAEQQWLTGSFAKVVVYVDSEEDLLSIDAAATAAGLESRVIMDSGRTEFKGVPTRTALAIGPDEAVKIDAITRYLPLL